MVNAFGIVGAVLSVIGVVIVAVGAALPHFVDVYIIQFTSQIDDSEPVAGVGVFSSEYDASVLSADVLAASGVPDDKFTTPTLEFPLLFPAQENFVSQVLPITPELAITIDVALQGNGAISQPLIDDINVIDALEFESCGHYIPDALVAVSSLFTQLQTSTLPTVVGAIDQTFISSINEAKEGVIDAVTILNENPLRLVVGESLVGVLTACGLTSDAQFTDGKACLGQVYVQLATAAAGVKKSILGAIATYVAGSASTTECASLTISQCFGAFHLEVNNLDTSTTALSSGIGFASGGSSITGCSLLEGAISVTFGVNCATPPIYVFYFGVLASLLSELDLTTEAAGIGLYLKGASVHPEVVGISLVSPFATDAQDLLANNPLNFVFPANFNASYAPCVYMSIFVLATGVPLTNVATNSNCLFQDYFQAALEVLEANENALAPTLESIVELYDACEGAAQNIVALCPGIFAGGILDGAFGGDITTNEIFLSTQSIVLAGIAECEDDVIDNEKVAQAQASLIASFVFYGLGVVVGLVGVFATGVSGLVFALSGVFSISAGVLTIAALLIVQSAPVYEGVGVEPNEGVPADEAAFEPFFENGIVVILALVAAIISFLAGISYFGATCVACRSGSSEAPAAEAIEAKEFVKGEKVEDVIPGTNVAI